MVKRFLRRGFLLLVSCVIILCGAVPAGAEPGDLLPPKKVAVVCRDMEGDNAAAAAITARIEKYFRTPLSGVLPIYSLIPAQAVRLPNAPKGKPDAGWVKEVAANNNADIVVVAELTEYSTYIRQRSWDDDTLQYSAVSVRYHVFDRTKDNFFSDKLFDTYEGSMTSISSPEYLLKMILDKLEMRLMKEIPFKPHEALALN